MWAPNGTQNHTSGANDVQKDRYWGSLLLFLEPICFQDRFRDAPGHRFARFLFDFGQIFDATQSQKARFEDSTLLDFRSIFDGSNLKREGLFMAFQV